MKLNNGRLVAFSRSDDLAISWSRNHTISRSRETHFLSGKTARHWPKKGRRQFSGLSLLHVNLYEGFSLRPYVFLNWLRRWFVRNFVGVIDLEPLARQIGSDDRDSVGPIPLHAPDLRPVAFDAVLLPFQSEAGRVYLGKECEWMAMATRGLVPSLIVSLPP